MACNFSRCKNGLHPFKVITRTASAFDVEEVVRWCPECGAIVVDRDCDGRTSPGYYQKIAFPNLTVKHQDEIYNYREE